MSFETEDRDNKKKKNGLLIVDRDLCPAHECVAAQACPEEALHQVGTEPPTVDGTKCTRCEICLHFCDYGALEIRMLDLSL
ncbi:MAG: 4Fe-4S ferredoxin [Clostridia bacterium]|nr:4Fe-4S ferredoxin [Clostridia bacterium]